MSETVVLKCPGCGTRFGAPVAQFAAGGRQVRCSRCRHVWFHDPSGGGETVAPRPAVKVAPSRPVAVAVADAVERAPVARAPVERTPERPVFRMDEPEEPEAQADPGRPADRRGAWAAPLLWLVALLLLLAILAYVFRAPLGTAMPRAAPFLDRYAGTVDRTAQGLVGRPADAPFELRNIHYDVKEYDGDKEILVEADLVNLGSVEIAAPKLRVRLVDAARDPLHASVIGPEDMAETIPAGGSTRYFVRIPEPPADFEGVLVNITDQE